MAQASKRIRKFGKKRGGMSNGGGVGQVTYSPPSEDLTREKLWLEASSMTSQILGGKPISARRQKKDLEEKGIPEGNRQSRILSIYIKEKKYRGCLPSVARKTSWASTSVQGR